MVIDFEGHIKKVVEYLEIEYTQLNVQPMYYQRTADDLSEQWVQRFREDLQRTELVVW
jgi:LPS sulfotransferase NodH